MSDTPVPSSSGMGNSAKHQLCIPEENLSSPKKRRAEVPAEIAAEAAAEIALEILVEVAACDVASLAEDNEADMPGPQPRRSRLAADKPQLATRAPQYVKANDVELQRVVQPRENEAIVTANYYPLSFLNGSRFASDLTFHRFDVEFRPFVPRIHRRYVVEELNKQHFKDLPLGFDGNTLCFALAPEAEKTDLGKQIITTRTVIYKQGSRSLTTEVQLRKTTTKGPVKAEDGTAFLQAINTCVKKALCKKFNLKVFRDVLWDLKNREPIACTDRQGQQQKYQLVRGYDITVKPAQTGFYLTIDDTSRIFKEGTVYEWMKITRRSNPETWKQMIEDRMRNSILYNSIGNELIRVAAVHFEPSYFPINFKFKWRKTDADGVVAETEISIYEYFKDRYSKEVEKKQPLIETVPPYKLKSNASDEEKALYESRKNLIPADLCIFTGLDQSEKSNFQLMKQINERTKPLAMKKKIDLDEAVRKYLLDDDVKKEMSGMNMKLEVAETSPFGLAVGLRARLIRPPAIAVGGTTSIIPYPEDGRNGPSITFERPVRSNPPVAKHQEDYKLYIVTTKRDEDVLKAFFHVLYDAASGMRMREVFDRPKHIEYAMSAKTADFSDAVDRCCTNATSKKVMPFIFVLVPDELKERYDQVKQVLLLQYGHLSQVVKQRTINKPNFSVATKVVMQVLAKMGTVNWALNAPTLPALKSLMSSTLVVGLDVHHDGERRGSVQAVVGTLDPRASVFYQRSRLVARGEEISVNSSYYAEYIKDMITARFEKNIKTEVIIVYRDGVSEGQIEMAVQHEYEPLKAKLAEWLGKSDCPYRIANVPKIIFVFVMKRHSTRFFQFNPDGDSSIQSAGYDRGNSGRGGGNVPKTFENPKPGTVVSRGIVRSNRAEFYLASHDTKEGSICPMRYEILRNETQSPPGMSNAEAASRDYKNVQQETIEDLTFYLTALYPNQCATIRLPVVCQLAQKFAMLSGQHLHQDAVDLQTNLRKKMFYL